jgi:hypothetical protein
MKLRIISGEFVNSNFLKKKVKDVCYSLLGGPVLFIKSTDQSALMD